MLEKNGIKIFPLNCKVAEEPDGRLWIKGYANTKNVADRYGDIPTVYEEKRDYVYDLTDFAKNPIMLIDHWNSIDSVAGSFKVYKEDDIGLYVEGQFSDSDFPRLKHARQIYKEGHAKALSISGRWLFEDEDQPKNLTLAKIYEISLVAVPADTNALVEAVEKALKQTSDSKAALNIAIQDINSKAEWTTDFINSLPDAAFAVIEPDYVNGSTENKRSRHLPHHNIDVTGNVTSKGIVRGDTDDTVDLAHYRNALARVNKLKPFTDSITTDALRVIASKHLDKHEDVLEKRIKQIIDEIDTIKQVNDFLKTKGLSSTEREGIIARVRFIVKKSLLRENRGAEFSRASLEDKNNDYLNRKINEINKFFK